MCNTMVKVLAHSGNSTFVPSGWFMHAWYRIVNDNSYLANSSG